MTKHLVLFVQNSPCQTLRANLGNPKSGWFIQAKETLDGVTLQSVNY